MEQDRQEQGSVRWSGGRRGREFQRIRGVGSPALEREERRGEGSGVVLPAFCIELRPTLQSVEIVGLVVRLKLT